MMWGKPSILIFNGKIVQSELKKNRFSLDELAESLRKKDITEINTVKYAILETDGTLNTILYQSEQAVTPSQMNMDVAEKGLPVAVISDGKVLSDNLRKIGRDENWLKKQLSQRGAAKPQDVFYMTVDEAGVYILLPWSTNSICRSGKGGSADEKGDICCLSINTPACLCAHK